MGRKERLDLGELEISSGSTWGAFREIMRYVVQQAPNHPGVNHFTVHADIQGERESVHVNRDGTLETKEEVQKLMSNWITEAKGDA